MLLHTGPNFIYLIAVLLHWLAKEDQLSLCF